MKEDEFIAKFKPLMSGIPSKSDDKVVVMAMSDISEMVFDVSSGWRNTADEAVKQCQFGMAFHISPWLSTQLIASLSAANPYHWLQFLLHVLDVSMRAQKPGGRSYSFWFPPTPYGQAVQIEVTVMDTPYENCLAMDANSGETLQVDGEGLKGIRIINAVIASERAFWACEMNDISVPGGAEQVHKLREILTEKGVQVLVTRKAPD